MIGRVRDFTEELFGEFGDELGKDFEDKNAGTGWDTYWDEHWRCAQPLGKEVDNINSYLKTVCDKNSYTCESLKKIFENVRGIETTYTGKTTSNTSLLLDYASVIKSFTDTMKYGDPKEPLDTNKLREDTQQLRDSLLEWRTEIDEKYAQEVEEAMNSLQTNGEYNWDTIEDWMHTNPIELTPAQIQALAQIYLSMEKAEDIEHFVACGYERDINYTYRQTDAFKYVVQAVTDAVTPLAFSTVWAEPYPLYEYDEDKMNGYIERMQILQIVSTSMDPLLFDRHNNPDALLYQNRGEMPYPIKLTQDENGRILSVQLAKYAISTTPEDHRFEPGEIIELNTSMVNPINAWEDRDYIFADWVTESSVGTSAMNRGIGAARSHVRSKTVQFLLDATFKNVTEGAAKTATIGVGIIIGIFEDYKKHQDKLAKTGEYLDEIARYQGMAWLGAGISYTVVGGVIIIHGVNTNTSAAIARSNGFAQQYGLDPEEFARSMADGTVDPELYEKFKEYIDDKTTAAKGGTGYEAYKDNLRKSMNIEELNQLYGDKYGDLSNKGIEELPPEVVDYIIDQYEAGN